jgi:hypothetical protein
MSLEIYAKHLAEKGRGPDDTLVHMSRDEVKSLNELAMAHGGQLTINPETGLPEAGFLSALLPIVAGAALGPAGYGLSAGMAGLAGGALSYALNPKAGLMGALSAGMGAYGGAGLGDALARQGMEQATVANLANNPEYLTQQEAIRSATANQLSAAPGAALTPAQYAQQMSTLGGTATDTYNAALNAAKPTDFLGKADMIGQGIKSTFTDPNGFSNLTSKLGGGMGTARTALSLAAPAIAQQPKDESTAPVVDKDMGQRYSYSPGVAKPLPAPDVPSYNAMLTQQDNFGAQQNYYPNQGYTPISNDAAKSLYHYAGGGSVEAMSNANAIGANTGFPQAYLHNNAYATPYQTPISQNVLTGASDVAVDPYTGEQRMATGGISEALRPENRDVNIYNDTGGPGSGGGPASASSSSSSTGSPTGSAIGDLGYAISNQSFSPAAAAIAAAAMDAMSPTSNTSVNAVNGMDAASDAASAAAAAANDSGGAPGMGGDGPGPGSVGDSGAAGGGGGGGVGDGGGEARGGLSPRFKYHMATGGISDAHYNLGGYSDGGRLLRGPGDGVSDSIPAMIGKKQPARLADGEFVVPARIVSELGNGSTEAGARKLYAMMDRVQSARRHTVGKGKVAKNSRADKYLPA